MTAPIDDILPPEPNAVVVRWMQPKPVRLGAAAAAAGLAVGVVATLALMGWLRARPDVPPPWRWGRP